MSPATRIPGPETPGRFIAVVGPSGVGKDTVMRALQRQQTNLRIVQRIITRPSDDGNEDHQPATDAEFDARGARGDFALWWRAHGNGYGIPATVLPELAEGHDVLANLSRGVLDEARQVFPRLCVLSLTATAENLSHRLAGRGREAPAEIAQRLSRVAPLPDGLEVTTIVNDGPVEETVAAALAALYPVSGRRSTR